MGVRWEIPNTIPLEEEQGLFLKGEKNSKGSGSTNAIEEMNFVGLQSVKIGFRNYSKFISSMK